MKAAIRAGLDKQTAQKVLDAWEASGASSPDELRKLLVKRSVLSAGTVLVQTALDAGARSDEEGRLHACIVPQALDRVAHAGASWGGFSTANYLAQGGDFFGKIAVQYVAYFLGLYFAIGVFLDLFLLGATAYSGVTYSTSAEAFLRYVKKVHAGADVQRGTSCVVRLR